MRPVLIGIDPGPNKAGVQPLDAGYPSGGRLSGLAGLSAEGYHQAFDRVNLYPHPGVGPEHDEEARANLLPLIRGRRVVTLGDRVSRLFGLTDWMTWRVTNGAVMAALPHPAGRNRWWNSPANTEEAKGFCRSLLEPCIHVEGVDGSGKSTLARSLHEGLGLGLIQTDDPPSSHGECLDRVHLRVPPGFVSDRSSGLISELVYGPVLRGGTIGPEGEYWDLLSSVIHAVTFVYCRPPFDLLRPKFREGEDPDHVSGVKKNLGGLLERYDFVMTRVSRMGGRVIRYDYTRQTPPEVIECVG